MDTLSRIIEDLSSLHWWITVFAIGVATSVLGAYVKPWLDSARETLSGGLRRRTEEARAEFERAVNALLSHPHLLMLESFEEIREQTRFLFHFLAMFLLAGMGIAIMRMFPERSWFTWGVLGLMIGGALLAAVMSNALLSSVSKRAELLAAVKRKIRNESAA